MRSSPIYNVINNPSRKSDSSFGSAERFNQTIRVGTSASNSHRLAQIAVDYVDLADGRREFRMFLDGEVIKSGILDGKEFELAA